jgi:precorrin-6Y C5,15-methyltransferase (decarboxylating)
MRWLSILGLGEDGVEGLAPAARNLISQAELVVGGARHLALVDGLIRGERLAWPVPFGAGIDAILSRRGRPVVVLASGDPFCDGVGVTLAAALPMSEILSVPAPSAFSLACSRLGWSLRDTATLSFCGRPLEALAPLLHPGRRILTLSADATTPAAAAAYLTARGFGRSRLHVLEALGGASERISASKADAFACADVHPLNLLGIEVEASPGAQIIPLTPGLEDSRFEHDGQITKREIRAATLSALAPRTGELLWDVGCGSGSIAIEWMLRHPANSAIGIEGRPERAARATRNALALGTPGLRVVEGRAPESLAGLPTPDAIFIGGGAHREGVIETAWAALRPGGRLVANAVVVETEAALIAAWQRFGGGLTRLSVERLDGVGKLHGFRPAMTVTQWSAVKP